MDHVESVLDLDNKIAILEEALKPDVNALSRLMSGIVWAPIIRIKLIGHINERHPANRQCAVM